ncbi:Putative Peptidase S16, lon-like (fragment) [Candidatus Nitrospira nitrosa]|uniref:Peptidase S16, lon-like n=1 Tax=Candidatus Nitrospira nitrosa TaxID=1742972 RepID=A0A0S4LF40_9BACT
MALNVNHLRTSDLASTPLEKQFLLEAEGLHRRARRLNNLVQFILHEHHGLTGWD